MTVNAGDILQVTINWNLPDATTAQNVFHYKAGPGFSEGDQAVWNTLDFVHGAALTFLEDIIDSDVTLGRLDVAQSVDGGATFFDLISQTMTPVVFLDATDMLPHVCSAKVFFGGTGTGREGRKSIPGIAEDWVTDSTILAAAVSDLVFYALRANDNVAYATGELIYGWLRRPSLTFIEHDGTVSVNTIVGTEARRKPGRGI